MDHLLHLHALCASNYCLTRSTDLRGDDYAKDRISPSLGVHAYIPREWAIAGWMQQYTAQLVQNNIA